jgi:hypothetical protein
LPCAAAGTRTCSRGLGSRAAAAIAVFEDAVLDAVLELHWAMQIFSAFLGSAVGTYDSAVS